MNVLSAFDGMSCAQLALTDASVPVSNYYASEVDKYSITVTQANYPNTVQLGDIKSIKRVECDLLIGGSPCQGFSYSGKRKGFSDERSSLFWEFVRILRDSKPHFFLLENVCMNKKEEQVISTALGVRPVMINSNLFSAQNRRRLYWTNINIPELPTFCETNWGDIRCHHVDGMYYTPTAMQWLGRHSIRNNKLLRIHNYSDKMQMVEASHHKKYSGQRFFGIVDTKLTDNVWSNKVSTEPIQFLQNEDRMYTVSTEKRRPFSTKYPLPKHFGLRFITPLECERLQTVPDNYTSTVSDTQRYKMLGNGFTVKVISHILSGLK